LKTIETASEYGTSFEVEWRTASRFRAQLSSVELTFLLANQVLSTGAERKGYPEARKLCSIYAVFDNFELGPKDLIAKKLLATSKASDQTNAHWLEPSCFSSALAKTSLRARRSSRKLSE
jgi:hypothetical protein